MSRFHIHRIQRMVQNPAQEKITPGLEAAAYLHWITLHESDPEKYSNVAEQLPKLRQEVGDYLRLTARETAAHLELMAATQRGSGAAVGTRDFQSAASAEQPPGRVESVSAQFGLNWVLVYWEPPSKGGKPWGYRVYRTDKRGEPVLVATVVEPEALLPEQPQKVKWYYYVTVFNGAGESEKSGEFGLMLNAPDEQDDTKVMEPAESTPAFPKHELPIRRELGQAMMTFMRKLCETRLGNDEEDSVMRQVATEEYRQAVEKAARQNVEVSLPWHTLAVWTEDGKERIGCFSRALECVRAESAARAAKTARERWSAVHMEADCLFEIGRVHFHEGAMEAARRFLTEALPLAQKTEKLRASAGVTNEDRLEGRIAELLLQLPEENSQS